MKFSRLRLVGFKTFVEATDVEIEPGLTGVVGPNGCGKSNLAEALRWVMGESSYKAMRASGMDDVIFSGNGRRPARNTAEVTLTLDNRDRLAPAAFNGDASIEVSRRIERDEGSSYRINGRDVRARDVQILFADASSGSRSPAMVRQGQVSELISAKPIARRAIIEEAAGISGLHARRHEAELRLRAAETNLERVDDVLAELTTRLEALRRQARQAARYREISTDIRKAEAALAHVDWLAAGADVREAEAVLSQGAGEVAERQTEQAAAATEQAVAAHELPALRSAEGGASAALARLRHALEELDAEERRATTGLADLDRRRADVTRDLAREAALTADTDERVAAIDREAAEIAGEGEGDAARIEAAASAAAAAAVRLAEAETVLAAAVEAHADAAARRAALERAGREAAERGARLDRQIADASSELDRFAGRLADTSVLPAAREAVSAAERTLAEADTRIETADAAVREARAAGDGARKQATEAETLATRLDTEAKTLAKTLDLEHGSLFPPLLDSLRVATGFEAALAAALGEDIDAPLDHDAPAYWGEPGPGEGDPPLPEGAVSIAAHVGGPPEIARRLAQIGLVTRGAGAALRAGLRPGQVLVSREGDLWRWDGYRAAAGAPTPAARRLASRNRLAEIDGQRERLAGALAECRAARRSAEDREKAASDEQRAAGDARRAAERGLAAARDALVKAERAALEIETRRAALAETLGRLQGERAEAAGAEADSRAAIAALAPTPHLAAALDAARATAADERARLADARARSEAAVREAELRRRRLETIARDRAAWLARAEAAGQQQAVLEARLADIEAEREALAVLPGRIAGRRLSALSALGEAEKARSLAADRLALGERRQQAADDRARRALEALSAARESRARAEERLAAARSRVGGFARDIGERFGVVPAGLAALAGLDPAVAPPAQPALAARLERLRADRERLGGVNLMAEAEADEVEARRDSLKAEKDDLVDAIGRLRGGIQGLNREARERLLAAFEVVNGHFTRLFGILFGGGTAELQLVEADDPLDAGLEILARPPGKRPQTLTLLSGGEQALTAVALIFAVFLTNPAPFCLLDEVDAPLDDANVERFCDLLDDMARETDTRFFVITHNPITMARMNRLYGVTMAERGVSQLVSVDLQSAEAIREAV